MSLAKVQTDLQQNPCCCRDSQSPEHDRSLGDDRGENPCRPKGYPRGEHVCGRPHEERIPQQQEPVVASGMAAEATAGQLVAAHEDPGSDDGRREDQQEDHR
jgi:hypothetical protein